MIRRVTSTITGLFTLALMAGCQGEGTRALPTLSTDTPLALEGALFYRASNDDGERFAVIADLSGKKPRASAIALPDGTVDAWPRPGAQSGEVVVLTRGIRATRRGDEIEPEVPSYVLRFDREGEVTRYPLAGRFASLSLSDDGRYAVAFAPDGGLTNDIALIDLGGEGADAVTRIGLRLLDGEPPNAIVFAPAGVRRLLVALMPRSISVLDLARLDVDEPDVLVPLDTQTSAVSGSTSTTVGSEVLFQDDTLFVRTPGARDVLMLQLQESDSDARGFSVAPLRLATTTIVSDVAVFGAGDDARVLALGNGRASLLEPLSGAGQELEVPSNLQTIVMFDATAPNDDQVRRRALLSGGGNALAFLDIGHDATLGSEGLEVISVSRAVQTVTPLPELGLAVLLHADRSFSVLDLAARTLSRLSATVAASDPQVDVQGGHARLWYALDSGALGVIDLLTGKPSELLFSRDVSAVVPLGGERDLIAAVTRSESGSVAILEGDALSAGPRVEFSGFTWSGFLD